MPRPVLRLAILAPLVVLLAYVAGVTPEIPLLDDWAFVGFAHRVAGGDATLRDWLAPHNGSHVVVVPRIVMTAVALATGGSGRVQLLVSFALVAWTAWLVLRMGDRSPAASTPALGLAQLATTLLLCSPASYRAFIWPVAFCHFTINASVVTAIWLLGRAPRPGTPARRDVALAIAACVVASTTRAEGLATWALLLPSLWLRVPEPSERRRLLVAWGVAAALCIGLVTVSLVALAPERGAPLPRTLLGQPIETLGAALGLIGMPFGVALDAILGTSLPSPRRYLWLGLPIVAAYLVFGARALRARDEDVRRAAVSWLALGAFGGLFVAATATARVGVLERAFLGDIWPSNYTVTAALVGVAALQLAALDAARAPGAVAASPRTRLARGAAFVVAIALLVGGFATRGPDALHHRARSRWSGLCWELFAHLAPVNACFVQQPTRDQVRAYEELGFRTIRSDVVVGDAPRPARGAVEAVVGPGHQPSFREVEGWVRVGAGDEAPIVFVELGRLPGLFAPARIGAVEGDRARWLADVPVLEGGTLVTAWVYRPEAGRLSRLGGELRVPDEGPARR